MILNNTIIEDVKKKSGLMFDKAGDFGLLSSYIFKETGRSIGVTTLKRLFNYINDERKTSEYTLNTIALYIGYGSWADYSSSKNLDSEWGYADETLYISALDIGTKIVIKYLNRVVTFEVCIVEGRNALKVISSVNSSLQAMDVLFVYRIKKGCILEAEKVLRGSYIGNYRTNGEIKAIEIIDRNN